PISVTILVSTPNPAPSRVTSLATIRSSPLRLSLSRALEIRSLVSAANPTITREPFFAASRGSSSEIESARILLDLVPRRLGGPEVRHRRRHHQRRAPREIPRGLRKHLRRAHRVDSLDPTRGRKHGRPRDHPHLRAAHRGGPRDRKSHLARRSIRHEPHRVYRLLRGPCRHQDPLARQILRRHEPLHLLDDRLRVGKPSLALVSTGEFPLFGLDYRRAALAELREVFLHRGMRIHVHV